MSDQPKIVCLCGSTRFKDEFIQANFRETMAGKIVLSVGWFNHADGAVYTLTEDEKRRIDELHLRKIDRADEVLVLDVAVDLCETCGTVIPKRPKQGLTLTIFKCGCGSSDIREVNYIGESTRREIAYAVATGKPVRYLSAEL